MEPAELETIIQRWPVEYRERALREIKARVSGERFVFYCSVGPTCDGNPHEGVPYQHARADQWPPAAREAWFVWMIRSGRGTGKTRTGAEWCRQISSKVSRIAMVGRRGKDVRGTMVEGPSGLIYVCERAGIGYDWKPSQMEFTFANGSKIFGYSAEEPDSLRGPQHGAAWLDEPAHMALIEEVWSNLLYGIRLPGHPGGARVLCTSTPLPLKWLRDLEEKESTKVVRVATRVNMVNLDPMFIDNVIKPLEGTRNGRQELDGEILTDTPGALWKGDYLLTLAPDKIPAWDAFERIIVGVDPAGSTKKRADATGIVVVGLLDGHFYVLADYTGKYSPREWAKKALYAYETHHADAIIAEHNFGGDMVEENLQNEIDRRKDLLPPRIIITRSQRAKDIRAEPIVGLYEHKAVAHVPGLKDLEDEMLAWVPGSGPSPNRVDALVFAITELHGGGAMTATAGFPDASLMRRQEPAMAAAAAVPGGARLLSIEEARAEGDRLNFAPPGRSAGRMFTR